MTNPSTSKASHYNVIIRNSGDFSFDRQVAFSKSVGDSHDTATALRSTVSDYDGSDGRPRTESRTRDEHCRSARCERVQRAGRPLVRGADRAGHRDAVRRDRRLDALAVISDPTGALFQYGVACIIDHVKPLSEALDWLAGDLAQIAAHR
ncbi:hypothetical protein ACIA5C_31750 [Actinoplanes sp. NPDC051343]|uniref:hypothetical protein n=1 Tax=Actinoplanes sp. NPDC051343 TaxID=3363906 RepID=UPI0037BD0243